MVTFLAQLFQSPLVFLIVAALLLIVLAIIGKVPLLTPIDLGALQRAGLAALGIVVIVVSLFLSALELAPHPGPSSSVPAVHASCPSTAPTDVTIVSPAAESQVSILITVRGTACHISGNQQLWILVVPDGINAYYPQPGPVVITDNGTMWSTGATIGQSTDTGRGFMVIAALANPEGSSALQTYMRKPGAGIYPLPGGIQLVAQAHVLR
jgi:hypothetical protein